MVHEAKIELIQQDLSALASRVKLSAMEKRRAATQKRRAALQMSKRKSSGWYEGASRSISIVKAKLR
jgi:hypothetical protein